MAQYDGSIRINTNINTRGLRQGENDIRSSVNRISSAAKKMASIIATAFAVGKITQFGKEALEAASDFEAMEAQFSQVFGDLEETASESLSKIASQAGIMEDRMKSSFTKIAAFAKTTGMDTASSLELANRAMVVVADSAAFYDRSLEETTESLQSFLKGNYENDAALGLSATEFTRNAAANKLYGKSFIELSEAQKQLTLLQMVEDANRLSGALGQAAREADTWANQTGNLSRAWTNLKANIGKLILPIAIQAVKSITNVINSLNAMISKLSTAAGAFRSFSELITGNKSSGGNFGSTGESISGAGNDYEEAAEGAKKLADATNDVADATNKAKKENDGYLSGLDEVRRYDDRDKDEGTAGIGNISSGIGQDIDYGNLAEGETVIDKLGEKALKLKEILYGLMKPFKDAWESEGASTIEAARFAFESLGGLVESVGKSFYEVWTNGTGTQTLTLILQIAQNVLNTIGNIAQKLNEAWNTNGVGTSIIQNIFDIYNTILGTIERITGATAEWAGKLDFYPLLESINGLLESMQPLTENIGSGLAWFYENVLLPIAGWTIQEAVPAFLDMLSAAISALNEVIEALKPLGEWLWENFLQPLGEWAGDTIISAMETITDLLTKFGDWISDHQETVQNFTIVIGSFAAAWGLVSAAVTIWSTVSAIATGATTAFGAAVAFLTSPITIAVAIIGSLIAIGVLLYKNWDKIKEAAGKLKDWIIDKWKEIGQNTSATWNKIITTISGIWNNIVSSASKAFDKVLKTILNVWDKIRSSTTSIWNGIQNAVKTPVNAIIGFINRMISGVVNGINTLTGMLNNLSVSNPFTGETILGFNIPKINAPQIPALATGAVIPPNKKFLAVLGDQKHGTNIEAPEALMRKAFREELKAEIGSIQQGSRNITYNFSAQINRRTLFDEMINEAILRQTATGRNPFELI